LWSSGGTQAQSKTPRQAKQQESTPKLNEQQPSTPQPVVASDETTNPLPQRRKPRRVHAPASRPEMAQVANHVTNEIATDFIPISYMSPANLQEGGQIVRVQLPRAALVNFGLPVNMDRYNEKVKADVLLGVDGRAHAIRFVQ
jgi:hypothetical protein